MTKINQAVGRDAPNNAADVNTVHALLAPFGRVRSSRDLQCETLATQIEEFQCRFVGLSRPDGRVDPGGRTLAKLVNPGGGPFFPLAMLPTESYRTGMKQFGWGRGKVKNKYKRVHAGCDLYCPNRTPVFAVADGEVVRKPKPFYGGAYDLLVFHPSLGLTVRYAEIKKPRLAKGSTVLAGQRIGAVTRCRFWEEDTEEWRYLRPMLHLEVYEGGLGNPKGDKKLPVIGNPKAKNLGQLLSTRRHNNLKNPTSYLDRWRSLLPKVYC